MALEPGLSGSAVAAAADILRQGIRSGQYTGRLPSAKTLAQEYEVSHKTSERALHHLVDEGLLVAVVGRGFFIKR